MKKNYIRFMTGAALVAVLLLQGVWLYNTYTLLEKELEGNLSDIFISSLEKETYLRFDDPARKGTWKQKAVYGFDLNNNRYANNKIFQDYLYTENYPISLKNVDSLFNEQIKKNYGDLNYSFAITDSLNHQTACVNHGQTNINKRLSYKENFRLRDLAPEYITLIVANPYKVILGKMALLLIGSLLLAIFVGYCLVLQINIIKKQNNIARIREDFTHALIHDMKNPATIMMMSISPLKGGNLDDNPEKKEKYFNIITQEAKRIHDLADRVLKIAHFEDQKIKLSKQAVNLPDLLNFLMDKYSINSGKTVKFHIELNGVESIYADQEYIVESFNNIIDNAIKYSKEKEDVEIDITSSQKDNYTRIIFRDKGIGISPKDQKIIFKKFGRASSVINSLKVSGFGIGLNFVYQVIKAHGGDIRVRSEIGKYSEFIINLPDNGNN